MKRGQSLVEATLVLLVFLAMLLGVIDCGQILYAHQALVERVRIAARWGAMEPANRSPIWSFTTSRTSLGRRATDS
jgi:Flp pilus assembly protein TadG